MELNDFEVANSLPDLSGMTPEAARSEIQKTLENKGSAYQDARHRHHKLSVERMTGLYKITKPEPDPKAPLTPEQQKFVEESQARHDREELRRSFDKVMGELQTRLLKEGSDADPKEIISVAISTLDGMFKGKALAEDFKDFLEESGEGDSLDTIRFFAHAGGLIEKYEGWKKAKSSQKS